MKQKDFTRLIDTIFATRSGDEMLCSEYFDELPRYVDLEVAGQDAAALLPEVKHHMLARPAGETNDKVVRLDFDHRLMLRFCAWVVCLMS